MKPRQTHNVVITLTMSEPVGQNELTCAVSEFIRDACAAHMREMDDVEWPLTIRTFYKGEYNWSREVMIRRIGVKGWGPAIGAVIRKRRKP